MDVGLAALIFVGYVGHYAAAACDVLRKLTLEGWAIAAWLASTCARGSFAPWGSLCRVWRGIAQWTVFDEEEEGWRPQLRREARGRVVAC